MRELNLDFSGDRLLKPVMQNFFWITGIKTASSCSSNDAMDVLCFIITPNKRQPNWESRDAERAASLLLDFCSLSKIIMDDSRKSCLKIGEKMFDLESTTPNELLDYSKIYLKK